MIKLETMEQKLMRTLSVELLHEAQKSYERFEEAIKKDDLRSMTYEAGMHKGFLDALHIIEKGFAKYEEEKGESI